MMIESLAEMLDRDLEKLHLEISQYDSESSIWTLQGNILNSAGTLCLHLTGNLSHFVGTALGNTGYVRNRDAEFSDRDVPKASLLAGIEQTRTVVKTTLARLQDADLEKTFPLEKHGQKVSTGYMLLHLLSHLNYHLGQVNYHRRLVGSAGR